MSKIYMFRHQAGGLLTDFLFAQPPTEQQTADARAYCEGLHGTHHTKTQEPYWLQVVERDALGPEARLPKPQERGPVGVPHIGVPGPVGGGVAHIESKSE